MHFWWKKSLWYSFPLFNNCIYHCEHNVLAASLKQCSITSCIAFLSVSIARGISNKDGRSFWHLSHRCCSMDWYEHPSLFLWRVFFQLKFSLMLCPLPCLSDVPAMTILAIPLLKIVLRMFSHCLVLDLPHPTLLYWNVTYIVPK